MVDQFSIPSSNNVAASDMRLAWMLFHLKAGFRTGSSIQGRDGNNLMLSRLYVPDDQTHPLQTAPEAIGLQQDWGWALSWISFDEILALE